jgi:hypothetical protein
MTEDLRNAVDWDSLRVEVFCPVKHMGEDFAHHATFYVLASCMHCNYRRVTPRCQWSVEVLAKAIAKGYPAPCPNCNGSTPASQFFKVLGEVNK